MSARTWLAPLLAAALLPAHAFAAGEEEEVPEAEKDRVSPLRERVPPVSGMFAPKRGRFEVAPSLSLSFRDTFFVKQAVGLEIANHLGNSFAIGVRGSFAFDSPAHAMTICDPSDSPDAATPCHYATMDELDGHAPGQLLFLAGANLQWAPMYGKVSLLSLGYPNFDFYLLLGGEIVGYKGPNDAGGSVLRFSVGGEGGLGTRLFLTRWLALRLEIKDLVYPETVSRLSTSATMIRQQYFAQLGFSIFLPTSAEER